jgi:hypothetical protein
VIVSDWSMQSFDGLAAFRIVRERGLDTPFIIVTGTIGEEFAIEALKAGVNDFMTKGQFARLVPAMERETRDFHERMRRRERLAAGRSRREGRDRAQGSSAHACAY